MIQYLIKVAAKHPLRVQSGHCHLEVFERGDPDHRRKASLGDADAEDETSTGTTRRPEASRRGPSAPGSRSLRGGPVHTGVSKSHTCKCSGQVCSTLVFKARTN